MLKSNSRKLMERTSKSMAWFTGDRSGNFALSFAIALIPIAAAAGAALDYSRLSRMDSRLQEALDAAALAAAIEYQKPESERAALGNDVFLSNTRNPCANNATITFNGDEVTATSKCSLDTTFLGIFGQTKVALSGSATAVWSEEIGDGCLYALDPSAKRGSLTFHDMDSVNLNTCVPVANSTHNNAIRINDLDSFRAGGLYTAGGYSASDLDRFALDHPALTKQSQAPDPYADIPDPSPGSCGPPLSISGSSPTLSPGVYCGGLTATRLTSLTFQPGTYYIVDGDLRLEDIDSVNCNCTASGSGVTFVLTGTTPAQTGTFTLSDISSVSLRAPSNASYDFPGMLLYVDRRAPYATSRFHGNGGVTLNGAIYTATQRLIFSDSDYTAQTDCAQTVAFHVEFTDMDAFGRSDNCAAYGTRPLSVVAGGNTRLIR